MVEKLRDIVHDDQKDSSIQRCLLADAAAAVTSAAAISPIITAADRSVVESVSTGRPLLRALAKHILCPFTNPRQFFSTKAVFVVCTLYTATYFTANTSETLLERFSDINKALTGTFVSSAVFAVNTPLSIWKDVRFAQFFGVRLEIPRITTLIVGAAPGSSLKKMPTSVSTAFLIRDVITVFGSFALAPQVSAVMPDSLAQTPQGKASVAQLIVPAMTQIIATPAHLLALDLYNRPVASGVMDRVDRTRQKLLSTTIMRAMRLIPAFGFGLNFNRYIRLSLRGGGYRT